VLVQSMHVLVELEVKRAAFSERPALYVSYIPLWDVSPSAGFVVEGFGITSDQSYVLRVCPSSLTHACHPPGLEAYRRTVTLAGTVQTRGFAPALPFWKALEQTFGARSPPEPQIERLDARDC
jgi:hypothetical protein